MPKKSHKRGKTGASVKEERSEGQRPAVFHIKSWRTICLQKYVHVNLNTS